MSRVVDLEGAPAEEQRGLAWWLERGAWSASDQALFALSNFAINVLLARRLPAAEYGAFVFAYSTFQLLGQVYIGMVVDPMQVFGAGRHRNAFTRYLRTLLRGHLLLTLPAALVLAVVGFVSRAVAHGGVGQAFLGLALASPSILLSWLLRGACTVRVQMRLSAGAGALNLGLVLAGLSTLAARGALSAFSAFLVMGVANLAAGAWLLYQLGPFGAGVARLAPGTFGDHWRYGRWSTGAGLLNWVPTEMFYLVLPVWGGLNDTAALRAMMNLLLPAVQLQYAVGNMLTPVLVRARGGRRFSRVLLGSAVALVLGFAAYWLVVGVFRVPLMRFLYAGRFVESSWLLWELGGMVVLSAAGVAFTSALRALERPDCVFWAALASSVAAVGSLVLIPRWGLAGVAAARAISAAALVVTMWVQLAGILRTSKPRSEPRLAARSA